MFRTRLNEVYKGGKTDFGGYFETVFCGCGSGCNMGVMVDVRDGKVYNLQIDENTAYSRCYSIIHNFQYLR
jgi:hypothetical protein